MGCQGFAGINDFLQRQFFTPANAVVRAMAAYWLTQRSAMVCHYSAGSVVVLRKSLSGEARYLFRMI
ncbi:MAG: hypothetical protein ACQEQ4_00420 [Fibrobacterota bacterium]